MMRAAIDLPLHPDRDALLTDFGKKTLETRYLLGGESYQDLFARVAKAYADDGEHAERLYGYISQHWFMPSTPVLANGGTQRGLPISCFLNEASDDLRGIVGLWQENVYLASSGGGIGSYWGSVRSIGEKIGHDTTQNGETSGIIPFIKVMDSLTLAISQGSLRRGSAAVYLPICHPEIEEFIDLRKPTGGDPNRKALNLNHGVVITDDFMKAVEEGDEWALRSPRTNEIIRSVSARSLWIRLLTARIETGEPYLLFIDHVNRNIPDFHRESGLYVKTSNLCSEITLPTGRDPWGENRTAVCCLSSVNLETFPAWETHPHFIEDCCRFLDNVLTDFIKRAPSEMEAAVYAAKRERSIGLGAMGFHSLLQSMGLPFEGAAAKVWNRRIFRHIRHQADAASKTLAAERGACLDAEACGVRERFSNKMAIAPTASISIICGGVSPGIEPFVSNAYTHKTLSGSFLVQNKHLRRLLEEKGKATPDVLSSITQAGGSVQHLDFLSDEEKAVFRTAFEIDQRWVIEHAADRQPFICQAQSLNLFLPADVHKRELHHLHMRAWKAGVKSLYYLRSQSIQRAESKASSKTLHRKAEQPALPMNYEECLACQ